MKLRQNTWYVAGWRKISSSISRWAWQSSANRSSSGGIPKHLAALEKPLRPPLSALSLGRCEGQKLAACTTDCSTTERAPSPRIPGQDLIPPNAKGRAYPVREKHSWVWVWMETPPPATSR